MLTIEEKQNKQKGAITSVIIHLLLLIFFLLYQAWPFDPPLAPQYGIEVQFGTSDVGSGDTQTEAETGESQQESEEISESETENTEVAETLETKSTQDSLDETELLPVIEVEETAFDNELLDNLLSKKKEYIWSLSHLKAF